MKDKKYHTIGTVLKSRKTIKYHTIGTVQKSRKTKNTTLLKNCSNSVVFFVFLVFELFQ
jgi:hypothetical protein